MEATKHPPPTFADPEAQAAWEKIELKRLKFFQAIEQQRRHRKLLEKRTPCDTDMERELLANLMVFWESKDIDTAWKLTRRDFFLEEHAMLFAALIEAKAKSIPAHVPAAFRDWLKESGWWKKIASAGGFESGRDAIDWLEGILRPCACVSTHMGYYAGCLRKHRLLRAWRSVADEIAETSCKPEATEETLLALATKRIEQLRKIEPLRIK